MQPIATAMVSCCWPKGAVRLTGGWCITVIHLFCWTWVRRGFYYEKGSRWDQRDLPVLDQKGHHGDFITTTLPVVIGFTIMLLRSTKIDAWVSQATCAQAVQVQVRPMEKTKRKINITRCIKGHHYSLLTEPVIDGRQWPPSALQDVFLHSGSSGNTLLICRSPTWSIVNGPKKGT